MTPDEDRIELSLRLPRDLHHRLVDLARRERRSLNSQVLKLLEDAVPPVDPDAETKHG